MEKKKGEKKKKEIAQIEKETLQKMVRFLGVCRMGVGCRLRAQFAQFAQFAALRPRDEKLATGV